MVGGLKQTTLQVDAQASRAAAHLSGKKICADLKGESASFRVHWCLIPRGDVPYLRQEVTIQAGAQPLPIADVQLMPFSAPEAHVVGMVAGTDCCGRLLCRLRTSPGT
jgi:hypothetical protein